MTVDLYIYDQPEPTRSILDYVHHLILHLVPDVHHTIKWKVPFYSREGALFYLNPIKKKAGGVELCFARARVFEEGMELLNFKGRQAVGGYTITSLEDISEESLIILIQEAVSQDEKWKGINPWKKR